MISPLSPRLRCRLDLSSSRQCSAAVEIEFVAIIDRDGEEPSGILCSAVVFVTAPPVADDVGLYSAAAPCTSCPAQCTVAIAAAATFVWQRID